MSTLRTVSHIAADGEGCRQQLDDAVDYSNVIHFPLTGHQVKCQRDLLHARPALHECVHTEQLGESAFTTRNVASAYLSSSSCVCLSDLETSRDEPGSSVFVQADNSFSARRRPVLWAEIRIPITQFNKITNQANTQMTDGKFDHAHDLVSKRLT